MLRNVKDPLPLRTPGVYEIPCTCGDTYIWQTGRLVSTRLKEHSRALRLYQGEKSAIAEHSLRTGHRIKFEESKVLAPIANYYPRIIREALEISKRHKTLNREGGYILPARWTPLVQRIKDNGRPTVP